MLRDSHPLTNGQAQQTRELGLSTLVPIRNVPRGPNALGISLLTGLCTPTPGLALGLRGACNARPAQLPAGNWHLQYLLCSKRTLIFSRPQEGPRGEVTVRASGE